jgi:hypothetical protein
VATSDALSSVVLNRNKSIRRHESCYAGDLRPNLVTTPPVITSGEPPRSPSGARHPARATLLGGLCSTCWGREPRAGALPGAWRRWPNQPGTSADLIPVDLTALDKEAAVARWSHPLDRGRHTFD